MTMRSRARALLLALAWLACLVPLAGCSQARCAWSEVKAQAQETFRSPCCPDADGNVYSEPVYEPCGGGGPVAGTGHGAFAIARHGT